MKQIPLTQGKFAIVDDDMFDYLSQWKWQCVSVGYAQRRTGSILGKRTWIYMHRQIMNAPKTLEVDHINGNKLDNRRENLRLCTRAQNRRNNNMQMNNVSGFKGVSWAKRDQKWRAKIRVDGRTIHIGNFEDPKEAARAYDAKARELHGEFARTNF